MKVLGIDLGATKLASAVFSMSGEILEREVTIIKNLKGEEVGQVIKDLIRHHILNTGQQGKDICSTGISVPGIFNPGQGTVWAPNIEGWDNFPLLEEAESAAVGIPVSIESDRACSVLGEIWKGNAGGCRNLVFLAVGTGIGAGILADGEILRGSNDIAGAIGWMALDRPFHDKYSSCGCFEYFASGDGLARLAKEYISNNPLYKGVLKELPSDTITSYNVFSAFELGDPLANKVISLATEYWGMAVANIISLLNPEKVILGGGLFGPAARFIPDIIKEARKWAQPVAMQKTEISASVLGADAAICGAGYLAIQKIKKK